jgi:type II secretory pathway pseudopilin PulG
MMSSYELRVASYELQSQCGASSVRVPHSLLRSGISLIEVLISIGIMAIGMLSIASLLPVGNIQTQKANVEERKAELGLNAYREFQIRGLGDFSKAAAGTPPWLKPDGSAYSLNLTSPAYTDAAYTLPVAIDPMMMAREINDSTGTVDNNAKTQLQYFPIYKSSGSPPITIYRLPASNAFTTGNANSAKISKAIAESICSLTDEIVVDQPEDRTQPATGVLDSTSSRREFEGNYTWLATLAPNAPSTIPTAPAANDMAVLSIVIFSRRALPASPTNADPFSGAVVQEDMVSVQSPPATTTVNIGGGEMTFIVSAPADVSKFDLVKPGGWLMLCRNDGTSAHKPRVAKWYRIISANEGSSATSLDVTLAGPDWVWDSANTTYACLFADAVAVYERVIHLEGSSVWSN